MAGALQVQDAVAAPRAAPGREVGLVRLVGPATYALANAAGVLAFAYLLWRPALPPEALLTRGLGAPLLLSVLTACCFLALAVELAAGGLGARAVAVLGVVVAMNSALRFVEVALPGPGGFTPIFVLIILGGYAYGARFGFLTGALTLAVSALITGGVGPWLPYQMYAAGWVGLAAGCLPHRDGGPPSRAAVVGLALFGAACGLLYGATMTIWGWSFIDAGVQGASGSNPLVRFAAYYLLTSLAWDAFAAGGTLVLMLAVGGPLLAALRRAGRRFSFDRVASAAGPGPVMMTLPGEASPTMTVRPQVASLDLPAAAVGFPRVASAIQPRAWALWTLGLAAVASATRNPFLLLGAALAVAVVRAALPAGRTDRLRLSPLRFAAVVVPVAALYNFLVAHSGATVVARLPATWPLIGGPLTLESLAYGALTGVALVVLVASFGTLRLALPTRDLVRLAPRALGALTLAITVAITYVPATLDQLAAVREAQAVRGHRPRGLRDWAPLAVPLVVGGLERALALAEAMTARSLTPTAAPTAAARAAVLLGLGALLAGWLGPALGAVPGPTGTTLAVAGVALMLGGLWWAGRDQPRGDYRRQGWRPTDTAVAVAAWLPLAVGLWTPGGRTALTWLPYPALAWPPLPPGLALALLGLAVPAVVLGLRPEPRAAWRPLRQR